MMWFFRHFWIFISYHIFLLNQVFLLNQHSNTPSNSAPLPLFCPSVCPSVCPSIGLLTTFSGFCTFADKSLGRNGIELEMQMFPDDLPLANIDADGYCCHFMRSSVRPTIHGLGFVYCIQSAWKKLPTIWHADVSRWLTLSIHGCLWILLLVCLSVHLSVCSFTAFSGGCAFADKSLGTNGIKFDMLMFLLVGGCQTCGTHISVTAWWIFSIRSSVELSRPVGVHCHGHMPICPIWASPWAKNLSNLPQIGSRLCGTHISETAGWIYPI